MLCELLMKYQFSISDSHKLLELLDINHLISNEGIIGDVIQAVLCSGPAFRSDILQNIVCAAIWNPQFHFSFYGYKSSFTSVSMDWKVRYLGFLILVEFFLKKFFRISGQGLTLKLERLLCADVPHRRRSIELRPIITFGAFLLCWSPFISFFLSSLSS